MAGILVWWVAIGSLGLAAFPIGFRLFRGLPDRGYGFAKILALVLLGYVTWLLQMLQFTDFTRGTVLFFAVLLGISGGWLAWRQREELRQFVSGRWPLLLAYEVLFLLAFAAFAWFRGFNPEIAGTEKPMDFALLNGILRSGRFPPSDPWMSGFSISYYYFGYYFIALLIRLTGVASAAGFNLGLSAVFALAATGIAGVVYGLTRRFGAALLGVFLALLASNPDGLLRVLSYGTFTPQKFWWWWDSSRVLKSGCGGQCIDEFPQFSFMLGDLHPHVMALPFAALALGLGLEILRRPEAPRWNRADTPFLLVTAVSAGALGFLNTWDLPAYLGLVLGCVVARQFAGARSDERSAGAVGEGPGEGSPAFEPRGSGALEGNPHQGSFAAAGEGVFEARNAAYPQGSEGNSWPEYGPSPVLSQSGEERQHERLGAGWAPQFDRRGTDSSLATQNDRLREGGLTERAGPAMAPAAATGGGSVRSIDWSVPLLLGAAAVAAYLPFYSSFKSQASGFAAVQGQTTPGEFLGMWGFLGLLAVVGLALLARLDERWLVGLAVLGILIETLTREWLLAAALPLALACLFSIVARLRSGKWEAEPVFVLGLLGLGFGLLAVCEVVYLKDTFNNRMNTIFKFYYEVWLLFAMAGAYTAWHAARQVRWPQLQFAWRAAIGLVCLGSAVYPAASFYSKAGQFKPAWTLDGSAFMKNSDPSDLQAIDWLNANVTGNAVIAEATGDEYSDYARFGTFTGLQSVLGWAGHELQWRGEWKEQPIRIDALKELYTTSDPNRIGTLLRQYDVSYVVVGPLERQKYGNRDFSLFQRFGSAVFQDGGTIIYQVAEPSASGPRPVGVTNASHA